MGALHRQVESTVVSFMGKRASLLHPDQKRDDIEMVLGHELRLKRIQPAALAGADGAITPQAFCA